MVPKSLRRGTDGVSLPTTIPSAQVANIQVDVRIREDTFAVLAATVRCTLNHNVGDWRMSDLYGWGNSLLPPDHRCIRILAMVNAYQLAGAF